MQRKKSKELITKSSTGVSSEQWGCTHPCHSAPSRAPAQPLSNPDSTAVLWHRCVQISPNTDPSLHVLPFLSLSLSKKDTVDPAVYASNEDAEVPPTESFCWSKPAGLLHPDVPCSLCALRRCFLSSEILSSTAFWDTTRYCSFSLFCWLPMSYLTFNYQWTRAGALSLASSLLSPPALPE